MWNGVAAQRYCSDTQTLLHSAGSSMMLRLWSNGAVTAAGFSATFAAQTACTTSVSVGSTIDWGQLTPWTCPAVAVLTTPSRLASNLVLTVTSFTVACPDLVVVRRGSTPDDPIVASYCGTHAVPFSTPSVNATALHVAFVGARVGGSFSATVAAVGLPRPTLTCGARGSASACATVTDRVVSNGVAEGCADVTLADVDGDADVDVVCVSAANGELCVRGTCRASAARVVRRVAHV